MKSFENFSSFIIYLFIFLKFVHGDLFKRFFHLKICLGDFSFSWRCGHRDLSFEDLCWRFIPFWRFDHGDFSFEDLFRRFFPFSWRCVHGDLSYEDLFRRFFPFSWKSFHGDLSFEDLFRRFFIFMKMCS